MKLMLEEHRKELDGHSCTETDDQIPYKHDINDAGSSQHAKTCWFTMDPLSQIVILLISSCCNLEVNCFAFLTQSFLVIHPESWNHRDLCHEGTYDDHSLHCIHAPVVA